MTRRRLALAAKVRCVAGRALRRDLPQPVPRGAARGDGRRHPARGPRRRQPRRPRTPLSADELATKFRLNASRVLDADAAAAVARAGLALPGAPDVSGLMDLVRGGDDA